LYRSFGYRDVKVSLETQRSEDGGEVALIFHIREGERRVHVEEGKPAQATISSDKVAKKRPPARVGQIFLTGNEWISDKSILAHIPLSPGQVLTFPDLQRAEKNLVDLGLFVVDPATGVHPTITVLDREGDCVYKDILITVKEKKAKDMGDNPK
jgi:outer membrane protein assembly factor BamA